MEEMSLELNNGRIIHLEELLQYKSYRGLLEGLPDRRMNEKIIKNCVQIAINNLSIDVEPLLLHPVEKQIAVEDKHLHEWKKNYYRKNPPAKIPDIVVISLWECSETARDDNKIFSALKIVWFQNEFALPIEDSIIKEIKKIDWEKYAGDYDI